ncbi:peroxisomal membrane protein PEX13-like [Palaemon carinicauda]|uniref:peroxisomal membrane protein PEX13-like n=1 Tax=Palaemon carinicauda TaxID=392227 RepID=UPI0035B5F61D
MDRRLRILYLLLLLVSCAAAARKRSSSKKRNDGPLRFGTPFPATRAIPFGGPGYTSSFGGPIVGAPPLGLHAPSIQAPPYSMVPPPMGRSVSSFPSHMQPLTGPFSGPPIHIQHPMNHGQLPFMPPPPYPPQSHHGGHLPFGGTPFYHQSQFIQPSQPVLNSLHPRSPPAFEEGRHFSSDGRVCSNCDTGKHNSHFKVHDAGSAVSPVRSLDRPSFHGSFQNSGGFPEHSFDSFGGRLQGKDAGPSTREPFEDSFFGSSFEGGSSLFGGFGDDFGGSLYDGSSFGSTGSRGSSFEPSKSTDDGRSSYASI